MIDKYDIHYYKIYISVLAVIQNKNRQLKNKLILLQNYKIHILLKFSTALFPLSCKMFRLIKG